MEEKFKVVYDVVIVGGGIGGLMVAYKLKKTKPTLNICILEKGNKITERNCPASNGKPCAHCNICSITSGMAGSGAYSDGKFNLGTAYGGTLGEALGEKIAMNYIYEVDEILKEHCDSHYPKSYFSNIVKGKNNQLYLPPQIIEEDSAYKEKLKSFIKNDFNMAMNKYNARKN